MLPVLNVKRWHTISIMQKAISGIDRVVCRTSLGNTEWYQQVYHMSLVFGRYRMVPTSLPHVTCILKVQNVTCIWEVQNGTNKFTTCHLYFGGTEWYQQVYHMSLVFGRYRMVPTSLPHVTCIWEVQNSTNKFTTCHLYLGGTEWYHNVTCIWEVQMVPSLPHVTCILEVQNGTNKFTTCHLYLGGTEWYQQVYHMSLVFGRYRMSLVFGRYRMVQQVYHKFTTCTNKFTTCHLYLGGTEWYQQVYHMSLVFWRYRMVH